MMGRTMNQGLRVALAAAIGSVLLGAGCFTTTIRSGAPASPASIEYDEKWHHGAVWGIAEISGPYDLHKICPGGWAEIKTETSFLTGLVQAVTYSLYTPQTVTVRCAATAAPPKAPPRPAALVGADGSNTAQ